MKKIFQIFWKGVLIKQIIMFEMNTLVAAAYILVAVISIVILIIKCKEYNDIKQNSKELCEIKSLFVDHINKDNEYKDNMKSLSDISINFIREQCRRDIKELYYKYYKEEKLPIFEKKFLLNIEDIYVHQMHCNTWAKKLIDEMNSWEVDDGCRFPVYDDSVKK